MTKQMPWKTLVPWGLLLVWLAVIACLSLLPSSALPFSPKVWDKLQHAITYALLTLLAGWVMTRRQPTLRIWLLAAVGAVAYGAVMEWAQALTRTRRHADLWDVVADAVGAGLVLVGYLLWRLAKGHSTLDGDRDNQ